MAVKIIHGNIFNSKAQTIVNTVNCVGVMGSGIALEFRLRFPEMFIKYKDYCKRGLIKIGNLWIYKSDSLWVLNFPTKIHWQKDSKVEYLKAGLNKFTNTYKDKGIKSISFPILGSMNGNISENVALEIMIKYLDNLEIPVEIYKYNSEVEDDIFIKLKDLILNLPESEFLEKIKIRKNNYEKLFKCILEKDVNNMTEVNNIEGIGIKTLEKIYEVLK